MRVRSSSTSGRDRRRTGMAVLITALMLTFTIPVVGLAIDAGVLYAVKAKLSSATDAAALAAARSLSLGLTIQQQQASATSRAIAFFNANFPSGTLGASNVLVNVSIADNGFRRRTVTVDAQTQAPVYFMRVLGFGRTVVRASGQASRRDVNLMLVMDRSGSMNNTNSCTPMKEAATAFVDLFANGRDRLGLITFGASYYLAYPPSMNFKTSSPTLASVISTITCTGATSSAMAISEAQAQIAAINEPGALNVILFFTDGLPNGITASFPVKTAYDSRFGYGADSYTSTSTTYTIPPSTCTWINTAFSSTYQQSYNKDNSGNNYNSPNVNPRWTGIPPKLGVLAGQGSGTASTGLTYGLYKHQATAINMVEDEIANSAGCRFASTLSWVRRDIAFIPSADAYGNSTTNGPWSGSLSYFTSGVYNNRLRPDRPLTVGSASKNAAYNAALAARTSNYSTVMYTIGLGDPGATDPPDDDFMLRISNDPFSPEYNSLQPEGLYVFSPNNAALASAFYKIASEILRIAR